MRNHAIILCTAFIFTLLLACSEAALAGESNPIRDPGFELQLLPEQSGWNLFELSLFSQDHARSGSQSMYNAGYSQSVSYPPYFYGIVSGSYQEFPAAPGSRWLLTGYGLTANVIKGKLAYGIVQVSFFDADGNDLGTVETAGKDTAPAKTSNMVSNKTPAGKWIFLDTGVATAPAGTATIQAFTLFVDFSGSGIPQGVYFDDLRLCELKGDSDEADCR